MVNGELVLSSLLIIMSLALFLNIPFGMWRASAKKFSIKWFLAIHMAIPIVVYMRNLMDLTWWYILPLLLLSVIGQTIGVKLYKYALA